MKSNIQFALLVFVLGNTTAIAIPQQSLIQTAKSKPIATTVASKPSQQDFSYETYAALLARYVDDKGMVNYKALKASRKQLDDSIAELNTIEPDKYHKWPDENKIAFWINAYNVLTLKAIIDNYPIKSSSLKSLLYPKNSIRQIPGVWDKLAFPVLGKQITLSQIEHNMLRKQLNEPRIHMALVCAAKGCPQLRNEPYVGGKLNSQLDDQIAKFLKNTDKFRIDRNKGRVYLSSIVKWFGEDFVKKYGTDRQFKGHSKAQRAVLNLIIKYIGKNDSQYLLSNNYKIKYINYDWSLNENTSRK